MTGASLVAALARTLKVVTGVRLLVGAVAPRKSAKSFPCVLGSLVAARLLRAPRHPVHAAAGGVGGTRRLVSKVSFSFGSREPRHHQLSARSVLEPAMAKG